MSQEIPTGTAEIYPLFKKESYLIASDYNLRKLGSNICTANHYSFVLPIGKLAVMGGREIRNAILEFLEQSMVLLP